MKKSRKILAVVLALLMLLSLSACGMGDLPLFKAALALTKLNSIRILPEGELLIGIMIPEYNMNMNVGITADGVVEYCADPLCFSANLQLDAMDETLNLLAYGEDRGGDFVIVYSTDGGESWEEHALGETDEIRKKMDKSADLNISDILSLGKSLGSAVEGFDKAGQEPLNDGVATRYDASVDVGQILGSEEARDFFYDGLSDGFEMDRDELEELIDPSLFGTLGVSLWLDESSRLAKAELDMTDLMDSVVKSGLLDPLLGSETGLDEETFTLSVESMRLALRFTDFDNVGEITCPEGAASKNDPPDGALAAGSTWIGTVAICNHAGKGQLENGEYAVWGMIGSSGGRSFFEIYDAVSVNEESPSPIMSFWAEIDGDRIVPDIDEEEQDSWLMNIYLTEKDEEDLIFTFEDGVLSSTYFYYDAETREACDVLFKLEPEA